MAFRIGTTEVQGFYLGDTPINEIFLDTTELLPAGDDAILLENAAHLLTEDGYYLLLERLPLLLTETSEELMTESGDNLAVEAA
jgi:hypothetical protein